MTVRLTFVLSTIEITYMIAIEVVNEVIWLRHLAREWSLQQDVATILLMTKHIDIILIIFSKWLLYMVPSQ